MSKRKHADTQSTTSQQPSPPPIFESTPIHDRSSTFTALFTPSTSNPRAHQVHPPFQSAMHKILAWRKPSTQQSLAGSFSAGSSQSSRPPTAKVVCETGSDEDGEKYAGKKLERVLTEMDVQGTVVVARWFGGVMLGPVRFKWIEDSAREAIMKWKASLGGDEAGREVQVKKVKVDGGDVVGEGKQKETVIRVLKERDASVDVLRGLLAEKNVELKRLEAREDIAEEAGESKQAESTKVPAVALEYESMPLQRLKQLERARDATLAWILKQIDAVEEKIKTTSETKDRKGG